MWNLRLFDGCYHGDLILSVIGLPFEFYGRCQGFLALFSRKDFSQLRLQNLEGKVPGYVLYCYPNPWIAQIERIYHELMVTAMAQYKGCVV